MFLSIPPRQVLPSSLACVLMISRLFPFFHKRKQPVCGRVVPCSEDALTGMRACGRVSSQGKRGLRSPAWDRVEAEGNELMVRIEENLLLLLNEHTGLAVGSDLGGGVGGGESQNQGGSTAPQQSAPTCWCHLLATSISCSHSVLSSLTDQLTFLQALPSLPHTLTLSLHWILVLRFVFCWDETNRCVQKDSVVQEYIWHASCRTGLSARFKFVLNYHTADGKLKKKNKKKSLCERQRSQSDIKHLKYRGKRNTISLKSITKWCLLSL